MVSTENFTGTRLDARVEHTTTRATHFMSIQLRHSPSRLFENKLSGTAWIGDVSFIASDGLQSVVERLPVRGKGRLVP
jgi:hypothetical protein